LTAAFSYQREFLIALLVAVWLHVLFFFVIAVMLVFQLISGETIESSKPKPAEEGMTEIKIIFEEEQEEEPFLSVVEAAPEEERVPPVEKPAFADTADLQEMEEPEEADFIGEKNTSASSDAEALAGDRAETALSGERDLKDDINTTSSDFSDGPSAGQGRKGQAAGKVGAGEDSLSQEESQAQPEEMTEEKLTQQDSPPADFVKIDGVETTLADAMTEEELQEEIKPTVEETPPATNEEERVVKQEGGSEGGFRSKKIKTRVQGTLNASGQGSLNVENSPLGRYQASIFKKIERQWQTRNFQFRSHLAPGHITIRFVIDQKGRVSGQRRVEMRGASDIQWGIVLNSISASSIPGMPKDVRKELGGEPLELNVTFNY